MNSYAKLQSQTIHWNRFSSLRLYFFYALIGPGLPMVLAFFAIPQLVAELGIERFGLLILVWIVIGYFSFFDLGLGRAAVRLFAESIGRNETEKLKPIVMTTLAVTFACGLLGSFLVFFAGPIVVNQFFRVPISIQSEIPASLVFISIAVPFISLTNAAKGFLEAQQRFRRANLIHAALGVLLYLGPLVIAHLDPDLRIIVAFLVAVRIFAFFIYAHFSFRLLPRSNLPSLDLSYLPRLLKVGGWMTVTNIVSPLIVYIDRFVIGAVSGIKLMAYYGTPSEAISRLGVISSAFAQILFPALSTLQASNAERAHALFDAALKTTLILLFPLPLFFALFSPEILQLWLGADFVEHSTLILQILSIGIYANMNSTIPYTLIQAQERADLTAKLHILEFLVYIPGIYFSAKYFGLIGAAIAWSLRASVDLFGMLILSEYVQNTRRRRVMALYVSVLIGLGLFTYSLHTFAPQPFQFTVAKVVIFVIGSALSYRKWRTNRRKYSP